MKRSPYRLLVVCCMTLAVFASAAPLRAQAPEVPKPTKQHEELATEVGVWDADVTMWPAPGIEPMKSKAVETNKLFGKFWLMSQFDGDFGGEKFTGHMMLGYDPAKKKYVGTWTDTMSPFLMTMEGDYDEATKTSTMIGAGTDWQTGKPSKSKMVTRYESDDAKTFEMYVEKDGAPGEWEKHMEIKYTRRK